MMILTKGVVMSPLVSVYITTHNRGERLIRAVQSVLNQTYKNIEIIISDDGSKDNTPEIVASLMLEHKNIRSVRSDTPKGANHARNLALDVAKGEFITGLDDDDEFKASRVELFVNNWNDKYAFICDNFIDSTPVKEEPHYKKKSNCLISLRRLLIENIASNQVFTRTNRLKEIGGFNEVLKRLQDWDCWLRLVNEYGNAIRFNFCSYVMYHHDEGFRVSNNIKYQDAYKTLVKSNMEIYESNFENEFLKKYILSDVTCSWVDVLKFRRLLEVKVILKNIITKP